MMNKYNVYAMLFGLLLTGCVQQYETIGNVPDNINELQNKQITDIKNNFVIAQNIHNKKEYFIGKIVYQYNKFTAANKIEKYEMFKLLTDQDGKIIKITPVEQSHKQYDLKAKTLEMPYRETLFSKLFADIGSVSIV